jgi:hypothetical protein
MTRGVIAIGLVALLAACSSAAPSAPPDTAAFAVRVRQVVAAWPQTRGAAWTRDYVPLDGPTLEPPDPGLGGAAEAAYKDYRFVLQTPLSATGPATSTIHFPDGGTRAVTLVTAQQAFDGLNKMTDCSSPVTVEHASRKYKSDDPDPCAGFGVTGVRAGSTPIRTSRGTVTVPAWLFTVGGFAEPFVRVAIDPADITRVREAFGAHAQAIQGYRGAAILTSVSGRTIRYGIGAGACDIHLAGVAYETDTVVALAGTAGQKGAICDASLQIRSVTVTLNRPLGSRDLIDALSGAPLTSLSYLFTR